MRESASNGKRSAHRTASSIDFTSSVQEPAMTSFDSAHGPLTTERFPPENLTRLPSALGRSPDRSRSTPASLSPSLYLSMAARSSSPGNAPASGSPLIINITRMIVSPSISELRRLGPYEDRPGRMDIPAL